MPLRPAWIQTSLHIRAVGSMLFAVSFSTFYWVCKRTEWILIRLCGCAAWSGSMLVANPLCWFCHDAAHICCRRLHLFALCLQLMWFRVAKHLTYARIMTVFILTNVVWTYEQHMKTVAICRYILANIFQFKWYLFFIYSLNFPYMLHKIVTQCYHIFS
jgi:hypothetical protein